MLLNGDASQLLLDVPTESVDGIVTDPPSGTNMITPYSEGDGRYLDFDSDLGKLRYNFKTSTKVNLRLRDAFTERLSPVVKECYRVAKPGSYAIWWAFPRSSHWLSFMLEDVGFSIIDVVVRRLHRRRPKSPLVEERSTNLVHEHEFWLLSRKPGLSTAGATYEKYGTGYLNVGSRELTNLWEKHLRHGSETNHPNEKPVALMRDLVKLAIPEGGTVLDPFAGSGSTLVAAQMENRDYIGIEQNDTWYQLTQARLNRPRLF